MCMFVRGMDQRRILLSLILSCLQDYLTSVSEENWTAWEENEAAQLLTFLGLDQPGEQRDTTGSDLMRENEDNLYL